ncbi:hypothetical protein D3C74_500960 [compost metagenome]
MFTGAIFTGDMFSGDMFTGAMCSGAKFAGAIMAPFAFLAATFDGSQQSAGVPMNVIGFSGASVSFSMASFKQ